MANVGDYLKGKQLEQAKEMITFAKSNKFAITFKDQSKDSGEPRILITIYESEKQPKSIWDRVRHATWYFYINDMKQDEGLLALRAAAGYGTTHKRFATFMQKVEKEFVKTTIANEILKVAKELCR